MSKSSSLTRLLGVFASDRRQLEATVSRRLQCRAATADVMQDIWLKLSSVGVEIENTGAFARKVARNAATDYVRKERRRTAIDEEVHDLLWENDGDFTPERILIGRQAVEAVEAALAMLPERSRTVFLMNRFEGLTHREIATRLGISETAVYYHIRRVLEHLALVKEHLPD